MISFGSLGSFGGLGGFEGRWGENLDFYKFGKILEGYFYLDGLYVDVGV